MASDNNESDSAPHFSDMDSPGSSVSSSLQREYEELLKYAVVTPKIQVVPSVYEQGIPVKDVVKDAKHMGIFSVKNYFGVDKKFLIKKSIRFT